MTKGLGGGTERRIPVKMGSEKVGVVVRIRPFGTNIGIVQSPAHMAGSLLLPFWGTSMVRPRVTTGPLVPAYRVVPSVYDAFRQTVHALYTYGAEGRRGEVYSLHTARHAAEATQLALLGLDPGVSAEQAAEVLRASLQHIHHVLKGYKRVIRKQEASQHLHALATAKDSLGRVNPSAGMARALALQRLLNERIEGEIMRIEPSLAARQKTLLGLILYAQDTFRSLEDWLAPMLYEDRLVQLFECSGKKRLDLGCQQHIRELEKLDFQPFKRTSDECRADLIRVRKLLASSVVSDRDFAEIDACLSAVQSAVQIKRRQTEIERINFRMLRAAHTGKDIPHKAIQRELHVVDRALGAIDEAMLRKPVCGVARQRLAAAIMHLGATEGVNVEVVRHCLRDASAAL